MKIFNIFSLGLSWLGESLFRKGRGIFLAMYQRLVMQEFVLIEMESKSSKMVKQKIENSSSFVNTASSTLLISIPTMPIILI